MMVIGIVGCNINKRVIMLLFFFFVPRDRQKIICFAKNHT